MEKLDGKTRDVVQDNIEKLKQLFPEVFTEEKIDFEKLQLTLGEHIETEKERYEFTWNGKTEAIQLAQKQSTGTLRPCKEESVDWDTTENLYIEGDNLEVLRLLQNSYRNKVKMIYIDPPYNTGKDFVYKDNFHDNVKNYKESMDESYKSNAETNGRYHTDWLNMMYPRLKLAKGLLKDDGVIFISIDDNEVANLKKICDEIFGDLNFAGIISWDKKRKGSFLSKNIISMTEYCLVYCKDISEAKIVGGVADETESQPLIKRTNSRKQLLFPENIIVTKLGDGVYAKGVYGEGTSSIELHKDIEVENGLITTELVISGPFIWSQAMVDQQLALGARFIINTINFQIRVFKINDADKYKGFPSLIRGVEIKGTNEDAYEELIELFENEKIFDYSKPKNYLKKFLESQTYFKSDEVILDFFSGSASLAHAIMDLNIKDMGKRKFIMVQIPEVTDEKSEAYKSGYKNICEIGKERIRRAGQKIKEQNRDKEGIEDLDIGFKVFKLDDTNLKIWDEEAEDIEDHLLFFEGAVKEGRSQEDVLYEILLKYGLDLTLPIEEEKVGDVTAFSVGLGYLVVCLDQNLSINDIEELVKNYPDCERMVFLDNGFATDEVKINAEQILKRNGVQDIRVI